MKRHTPHPPGASVRTHRARPTLTHPTESGQGTRTVRHVPQPPRRPRPAFPSQAPPVGAEAADSWCPEAEDSAETERLEAKGMRLGPRAARRGGPGPSPRTPQGPQEQNTRAHGTTGNPQPQRQVHTCGRRSVRSGVLHSAPRILASTRSAPAPAPRTPQPAPAVSPARPTPGTRYAALPIARTVR